MILAAMLATDRDALVCDMAQTYHVLNMTALPVPLLATLAAGLRGDSRIKMAMAKETATQQEVMTAAILDRVTTLCWMNSKDGAHGRNRPKSVLEAMTGKDKKKAQAAHPVAFNSPEEFDKAWAETQGKGR